MLWAFCCGKLIVTPMLTLTILVLIPLVLASAVVAGIAKQDMRDINDMTTNFDVSGYWSLISKLGNGSEVGMQSSRRKILMHSHLGTNLKF
jgi:hypothetical protein